MYHCQAKHLPALSCCLTLVFRAINYRKISVYSKYYGIGTRNCLICISRKTTLMYFVVSVSFYNLCFFKSNCVKKSTPLKNIEIKETYIYIYKKGVNRNVSPLSVRYVVPHCKEFILHP